MAHNNFCNNGNDPSFQQPEHQQRPQYGRIYGNGNFGPGRNVNSDTNPQGYNLHGIPGGPSMPSGGNKNLHPHPGWGNNSINNQQVLPPGAAAPLHLQAGRNNGGEFQLRQNNNQFYHAGVETGSLSNPLAAAHFPGRCKPPFQLTRDEMKERLADSLAADTNITCLPGFQNRDDFRVNSIGSFPQIPTPTQQQLTQHQQDIQLNSRTHPNGTFDPQSQRKMFGNESYAFVGGGLGPSLSQNPGGRRTKESIGMMGSAGCGSTMPDFTEVNKMSPFATSLSLQQLMNQAYLPPAGISSVGSVYTPGNGFGPFSGNNVGFGHNGNFRKQGREGIWASMGTPGPDAKAQKDTYRLELKRQIEQTKMRRDEETRREKDVNDHPLGANYAQPRPGYIPPAFLQTPNQSNMEIAMGMGGSGAKGDNGHSYMDCGPNYSKDSNNSNNGNNSSFTQPGFGQQSQLENQNHNNNNRHHEQNNSGIGASVPKVGPGNGTSGDRGQVKAPPFQNAGTSNSIATSSSNSHPPFGNPNLNPWSYGAGGSTPTLAPNSFPVSQVPLSIPMLPPPQLQPAPVQPWPLFSTPIPFPPPPPFQHPPPFFPHPPPPPHLFQHHPLQLPSPQNSNQNQGPSEGEKSRSLPASLDPSLSSNDTRPDNNGLQTQAQAEAFHPMIDDHAETLKQYTWQTSDQLPDPALKTLIYKKELRQQILQKKRDEEKRLAKEKEEEDKLERRIREYDDRMRQEVDVRNRSHVRVNPSLITSPNQNQTQIHRGRDQEREKVPLMSVNDEIPRDSSKFEMGTGEKRENGLQYNRGPGSSFDTIRDGEKYQMYGCSGDTSNNFVHFPQHEIEQQHHSQSQGHQEIIQKPYHQHQQHMNMGGDFNEKENIFHAAGVSSRNPSPVTYRSNNNKDDQRKQVQDGNGRNKNMHALSDILNSLGLETRRMEKVIQKKINF